MWGWSWSGALAIPLAYQEKRHGQPRRDDMTAPLGRSVSIDAAAQLLKVTRRTVYNWIRSGHLQTIRVGASQRVLVESIGLTNKKGRRCERRPSKTR